MLQEACISCDVAFVAPLGAPEEARIAPCLPDVTPLVVVQAEGQLVHPVSLSPCFAKVCTWLFQPETCFGPSADRFEFP